MPLISLENLTEFKNQYDQKLADYVKLDNNGYIPANKIPFKSSVEEYADFASFPQTGEADIIYVDLATRNLYVWQNNSYVSISSPDSIKYTAQELNTNQKNQARANIEAASAADVTSLGGRIDRVQESLNDLGAVVTDVVKNPAENTEGIVVNFSEGDSRTINFEMNKGAKIAAVSYADGSGELTFLDSNGDALFPAVTIVGGGGSGSGSLESAVITRITESPSYIRSGRNILLSYNFVSTDAAGETTTPGIGTWTVNGRTVLSGVAVKQGDNKGDDAFDVTPYLSLGENTVRLTVEADLGQDKKRSVYKSWTIYVTRLEMVWNYNDTQINESAYSDSWTVYGDIEKTSYTVIDPDTESERTLENKVSTRMTETHTLVIPKLSHGSHVVKRWLSATINDKTELTDPQYHEMIFVEAGNTTPIISCSLRNIQMQQYDTIEIPIVVYDPTSLLADAELYVDDVLVGAWTQIDRTAHPWMYTPTESGDHTLKVKCRSTIKEIAVYVSPVSLAVTEQGGYDYKFKASTFASNEAVRAWSCTNAQNYVTTASFSDNFDWINGGLQTELGDNGYIQQYFCVKAGTWMKINHYMFANDPKTDGMNFKIIFKVVNCRKYDTEIARCYSDHGLRMLAHNAYFGSNGTTVDVPYGEDEYIELEFDVYPSSSGRYIMSWMDGVLSSYRIYGAGDTFSFDNINEESLKIGSEDCDVYVYLVKMYPSVQITPKPADYNQMSDVAKQNFNIHETNFNNHIANFIMDAPNAAEMIARNNRNDILAQDGSIDSILLSNKNPDLRVWEYDIPRITVGKKDKVKGCKFYQRWKNGGNAYALEGTGTMTVQGTSSVKYIRGAANTDIKFSSLTDGDGNNLVAGGTEDETYGNNLYTEDASNPGHAKQYNLWGARVGAGIVPSYTEAEAIAAAEVESAAYLPNTWVNYDTIDRIIPTHYVNNTSYTVNEALAAAGVSSEEDLGSEWVVNTSREDPISYKNVTIYTTEEAVQKAGVSDYTDLTEEWEVYESDINGIPVRYTNNTVYTVAEALAEANVSTISELGPEWTIKKSNTVALTYINTTEYTVAQALEAAGVISEDLLDSKWAVSSFITEVVSRLYINTTDYDGVSVLGPEWIVIERNSSGTATKFIHALGFKLNDDSCPITYSNTKVNFASCEQVNNMCNAAWYQRFNPYPSLTPRDCMEFNMGVQFIKDAGNLDGAPYGAFKVFDDDHKYHMYSIANMGTSKKNVHLFHDLSNPDEVCIEVNDNNMAQMRMISDDLSKEDWSGDVYYGMRYPDTKNPSQRIRDAWQTLVTWFATNNPSAATGNPLPAAETYAPYTFRGHSRTGTQVLKGTTVSQYAGTYEYDTFERRMAKMLSECEDHMVMDSFVYHFCYLERHTMVDNVSKNNFWSSSDLQHWDLSKAYDMDTSDGNNNQGQMVFDYGLEYDDRIQGGKTVFNGGDSVWFVFVANLYEACQKMFTDRENAGAWSSREYHQFMKEQQKKVPERCWNQCFWYDYIRTYEYNISGAWTSFLAGGQKMHQRSHYEYFQEQYMSSKYRGTTSTLQNVNFRAYRLTGNLAVPPSSNITIKMYNKMYISVDSGTTSLPPVKVALGETKLLNLGDIDEGGTLVAINSAPMIQEIGSLAALYPNTCDFSNATRLKSLEIGSSVEGYVNNMMDETQTISLTSNRLLEELYVQNLVNANFPLDLSVCSSLKILDATGSGFTDYMFANGGMLTQASINRPTSLTLRNLSYLQDQNFTVADYSALLSLFYENTPGISSLNILNWATALRIARLIGIDWELSSVILLNKMYDSKGLNETGGEISRAVLTGNVSVPQITQSKYNMFTSAWPQLEIDYGNQGFIEPISITFLDWDGSAIKDKQGNDYIQYVDPGESVTDPVAKGIINTPTRAETDKYTYTFLGWDSLPTNVRTAKTVTATYSSTEKTFTVRWLQQGSIILKTETNVRYGTELIYEDATHETPGVRDEDGMIFIFQGWDKSTGYITGNTDVYARWQSGTLPTAGTTFANMSVAQIKAAANEVAKITDPKSEFFGSYANVRDYQDITLGRDFDFDAPIGTTPTHGHIESAVLCSDTHFDGTSIQNTNIKLFRQDENNNYILPSFTMAIDYEFTEARAATLVSAGDSTGGSGFKLSMVNHGNNDWRPTIVWGSQRIAVGNGLMRGIVVVRYNADYPTTLYVAYDNVGPGYYNNAIAYGSYSNSLGDNDAKSNASLVFGGYEDTTSARANGTIHWCKLWYGDLGTDVIKKLATWPHEQMRIEYVGTQLYDRMDSKPSAATFIFNSCLSYGHNMQTSGDTVTGWGTSSMRTFVNSRVFNALPIEWQQIIQTVKVVAHTNTELSNTSTFEDKVYVPSCREFFDVQEASQSQYDDEFTEHIPWFTTIRVPDESNGTVFNYPKVRFYGITIPVSSKVWIQQSDPTSVPGTSSDDIVHEGDLWVTMNSSSTYDTYIYVSPGTAAKHAYLGGIDKTNTDSSTGNKVANGTQSGTSGGYWVRGGYVWTRTPAPSNNGESYIGCTKRGIMGAGSPPTTVYGVMPMFSI